IEEGLQSTTHLLRLLVPLLGSEGYEPRPVCLDDATDLAGQRLAQRDQGRRVALPGDAMVAGGGAPAHLGQGTGGGGTPYAEAGAAPPDRERLLQRLDHQQRRLPTRERSETDLVAGVAHDREPGERLGGQRDPYRVRRPPGPAVVAGLVGGDQPQLPDPG